MRRVRFYIASTLSNADQAEDVAAYLRARGWIQTFNWAELPVQTDIDQLPITADLELEGVMDADILFLLMPARRGSHIEMGAALAAGIPVVILSTSIEDVYDNGRPVSFYYHPLVAEHIIDSNWFSLACQAHKKGGTIARKHKRTYKEKRYVKNA